jgi:hypothetical protein
MLLRVLDEAEISRVVEMAWEDRTPFEAIELQFGLNQDGVIKLMRRELKLSYGVSVPTAKRLNMRSCEARRFPGIKLIIE